MVNPSELKKAIESLEVVSKNIRSKKYDPKEHIDKQRANIAKVFVWGFFILVASVIVVVPIYNLIIYGLSKNIELFINLKDLLLVIGSLIGTSLGFVVGYYFKNGEN